MGLYTDPNYFEKQSSYQESKKSKVIKSIRDHFIRPCYLRESETPLKFYKLIRVCLPIGAVLNFFLAIQATVAISTAAEAAKPYFIIDAIYMWLGIVLLLGAAAGLNRMEWSGVRFYSALFGWQIVYNAFLAILGAHWGLFDFEYFGRPIMEAVFLSVWLYFCLIYFGKRRLLFSPGAFDAPEEPDVAPNSEAFSGQAAPASPDPVPSEPELPAVIPEKPTKKGTSRELVIVLAAALVISLAGNIWQGVSWASDSAESAEEIRVLNNKLTQKEEAIKEYRTKVGDLNTELARVKTQKEGLYDHLDAALFLYNNIGFIVNGSSYYHNYECPVFQAASEYWAHNIEYCQSIGYSACPVCWD